LWSFHTGYGRPSFSSSCRRWRSVVTRVVILSSSSQLLTSSSTGSNSQVNTRRSLTPSFMIRSISWKRTCCHVCQYVYFCDVF
jgi:hypothetical protein